ncbi:MAG: helix-turn-helix domain-containing protein [Dechloromonas sp.]|nr:MAG: helix-turn-helix domain-containing protein [Dechloromonas sp.]
MNALTKDPYRAQRELLAACPLFAGLSSKHVESLVEASRVHELAANGELFRAGETIREAHLLFRGSLTRTGTLDEPAPNIVELIDSPQLLCPGELFAGTRHTTTATAISHCLLVAIDIHRLRQVIRQDSELSWRLIHDLASRQCALEGDASGHRTGLTGTRRTLDYLLELAGDRGGLAGETSVVLKASKKTIAARIGMTPESFSRSLRELSDNGVIVVDGRNVHIQRAALLDTAAGDSTRRLSFSRKPRGERATPARSLAPGPLINSCGRLRVLSQRMAITWGLIASGIAPSRARVRLRQLEGEFDRTLTRLTAAGLPPSLGDHLQTVAQLWPAYRSALIDTVADPADAPQVLGMSEEILGATDRLTGQAERATGTPAGRTVNVAGRNRMLSQRIGKFFLFSHWVGGDDAIRPQLEAFAGEFDDNLAQLRQNGRHLPELAAQLQEVAAQWQKFRHALAPELGRTGRAAHVRFAMAECDRLLRHVDTAVKLYERLAG